MVVKAMSIKVYHQYINGTSIKGIIMVYAWSLSFVFDLAITLLTVIKSRPHLADTEFLILTCSTIITMMFKLNIVLTNLITEFRLQIFGYLTQTLNAWLSANFSFILSMAYFYYSLYHVTIVNSKQLRIHDENIFAIYLVTIVLLSLILSTSFLLFAAASYQYMKILPPFLPTSVYVIAAMETALRLRKIVPTEKMKTRLVIECDSKSIRNSFKVFSILSVVLILSNVPTTISYFFAYDYFSVFDVLSYIGDFFFLIITCILVYIHEALNQTVKKYISKFRSFF